RRGRWPPAPPAPGVVAAIRRVGTSVPSGCPPLLHQAGQLVPGGCCGRLVVHALLQEGVDGVFVVDRGIHQRVRSRLVGPDVEKVLGSLAGGERLAQRGCPRTVFGRDHLAGDPRNGGERVDGGKVAGNRKLAVEHDVPVEDGSGGVGDRLIVVVTVDEHRVDTGDGTALGGAGAF